MISKTQHGKAEGFWQVTNTKPTKDDFGKHVNDVYTFFYSGDHVILRLLSMHKEMWRSDDDFYKLLAKWDGNILYYLPPFGDFVELASFENGRFVNTGDGVVRIFSRIEPAQVKDWNADILKHRYLHDYSTTPKDKM